MIVELVILFTSAVFASMVREYYGNKGIFVLPKKTDKGLVLGSFGALISGVIAVIVNVNLISQITNGYMALSLGFAWGIAAPDVITNLFGRFSNKEEEP